MTVNTEFLKIQKGLAELEVAERNWIKENFLALAHDHKTHCKGCDRIHLESLKLALDRLQIKYTYEEGMEFS